MTNYNLYRWHPLRLFLTWMVPSPILTWLLFLFFCYTFFIYSIWNFFFRVFFYLSENFHQIWISFLLCCYSAVLVFICSKHNINTSWIKFSSMTSNNFTPYISSNITFFLLSFYKPLYPVWIILLLCFY